MIKTLKSAIKIYRAFDIRLEIDAVIAKVFDALTTADGLNSWWTDDSKVDPRKEGKIEYVWHFGKKSIAIKAIYRHFDLPHGFKVEYLEWIDEVGRFQEDLYAPPISQCFELHAKYNNKTNLSIVTSGLKHEKKFDKLYDDSYQSWVNSLANLKSVCETGKDLRKRIK